MGRHAASEESTVSPPRSNSWALRDFAAGSPAPTGPAPAEVVTDLLAGGVATSAAPGNRPAGHSRAAVQGRPTNNRATNNRATNNRAAVNPDAAISAADLIARFRESGLLTDTVRTRRPQPAEARPASEARAAAEARPAADARPAAEARPAADARPAAMARPAVVQRVKAPTGPIRVADLLERHPHLVNETRHGHRAGAPGSSDPSRADRRAGARSRSAVVRVLPALRPEPSIRVAVRPVLTVAAIIATVGLIEAPTLFANSHSTADARPAATTGASTAAAPDAALAARMRVADNFPKPAPVTTTAAPTRVSRSTRRAIGVPAKAAAANHVPLLKPGQTVPGTWIRPSTGRYTSCFCARWGTFHAGIDLASPLGTPIVAVGDGTVIKAGPASGFGNWVVIQHANGDVSIYGHMRYFFVHVGQKVTAGEKIALVGDQGFSTGPHLHFEIHQGGFTGPKINPIPWLKARGIVIGALSSDG